MAGMSDYAFSVGMRDVISKFVAEEVNRLRPKPRYGVVDSIDIPNKRAGVIFNGETSPVLVSLGAIIPAAVGAQVRVGGVTGDRYVDDVFSPVLISGGTGRFSSTTEATLTSTDHAFQIGADASTNLIMDINEVQVRQNGVAAVLLLNPHGGGVQVGGSATDLLTVGDIAAGNLAINGNQIRARTALAETASLYLNHASSTTTPRVYIGKGGNLSVGSSGSDLGGGATGSDQVNTAAGYLRLNWETSNPVAIGGAGSTTLIRAACDIGGQLDVTGAVIATGEVYGTQMRVGSQAAANVVINGNHVYARNGGTNNGTLNLNSTITGPVNIGTNGQVTTVATNALTYPNFPTAGTANASLTAGGVFQRISSARKYKENIRDLEIDVEAAFKLVPRQFHRNDKIDAMMVDGEMEIVWFPVTEDSPWETGFVAEEAEELGLDKWVEYDREGEVEGFHYMNWIAAQQAMLRHQKEKIDTLEERLASLEQIVASLNV
jgi:uncharacterized protein YuzE